MRHILRRHTKPLLIHIAILAAGGIGVPAQTKRNVGIEQIISRPVEHSQFMGTTALPCLVRALFMTSTIDVCWIGLEA